MKKFVSTLMMLCLSTSVYALSSINTSDYEDFDNTWANQKVITNQEFETTVNALEEKKNSAEKKEQKKRLKKFKGQSLHKDLDASFENLPDQTLNDPELEEQIILFPVDILVGNTLLEKGYYRAIGEKKENAVFINLYQSHQLKAKIKANETQDDFGEKEIMFAKLLPYKTGIMKLIFGSIDLNAYTYVRYIEPVSDFTSQ